MSDETPGRPPGDSAGPAGPGQPPYQLLIIVAVALIMGAFLAIAIWAGMMAR